MAGLRLKRLELRGFKSFADRTVIDFGPGVTVLVGPNGAGKSNLVEAIRWVLGEPSPRSLRGERLEDVIFAGSAGRRPLGLCEVSLTLDNEDGRLPLPQRELTITRRADRGGGSEVAINRQPCRLRDVHELLYGTALGRSGYSLIAQGQVDEVLSATPEERRVLIEEAAGITRYKARRAEAARRMEAAARRVERLRDQLDELARRLLPLEQEAGRARRYRGLQAEAARLRAWLGLAELLRLQRAAAQRAAAAAEAEERLEAARRDAEAAAARVAALRREREEAERALEQLRGHHEHLAARAEAAAAAHRLMLERLHALERQEAALAEELAAAAARARRYEEDEARDREALAAAQEERQRWAAELLRRREELAHAEAQLGRVRDEASADRAAWLELATELERWAARRAEADARRQVLQERARQAAERGRALQEALAAEAERAARLGAERDRLAGLVRALEGELEAARREHERARALVEAADQRAREAAARLEAARARVALLEAAHAEAAGLAEGVRAALRGAREGQPAFAGIMGVVADWIEVEPELELAVQAALGPALQYLIARSGDDAQRAVEELRRRRAGRATLLPLDALAPSRPDPRDREALAALPGVIGWALDHVRAAPAVRPALEHLLGRTLLAADLASARAAARAGGFRYRVVTREGDLIAPGGAITGGSPPRAAGAALLGRLRQLERARAEAAAARAALEEAERERAAARARWEEVQAAVREREERLRAARLDLSDAERSLERVHALLGSLQHEAAQLEAAREAAAAELARLPQPDGGSDDEPLRARYRALGERVQALEAERQRWEAERARAARAAEEAAVALAAAEQRCRALTEALGRLAREGEALGRERAELAARLEGLRAEREAAAAEAALLAREADERRRAAAQARERVEALRRRREEALCALAEAEAALERARAALAEHEQRAQRARLAEAEARARFEQARAELAARGIDVDAPLPEEGDPAAWRARLAEVEGELAAMGEVNLLAEREHAELSARYAASARQCRDLEQAQASLARLLDRLDGEMEARFEECFGRIRDRFREVFRRLFGGGGAELVLVPREGGPPGVEIAAQPPGKRVQHLASLSGGERALTAIALLFALVEVHGPPFCVLDEIDAALDDENLRRFASYLRALADRTQFIVVTHQKITMEAADVLYGVTMEEEGVSRIVGVRMADPLLSGRTAGAAG